MDDSSITAEPQSQRIGIAADHAGFELKHHLAAKLREAGHEVNDFGDHRSHPEDDYPDFVFPLACAVASGEVDRGIAICGSGVGASLAASKVDGVRACLIHETFSARQGVEDDDLNLICLGGLVVGEAAAWELVQTFLAARFNDAERHRRRLAKLARTDAGEAMVSAASRVETAPALSPPPHQPTDREAVEVWENEGDPN